MNIGIFLPRLDSQSGGGYTFSTTILNVLYRLKSNHKFYVFYYGKKIPNVGRVTFVPLVRSRLGSFNFLLFLALRYIFKQESSLKGPLSRAVRNYDIDLMWYITPSYEATDTPFIFTVWDLQHRLQPFFPEVSTQGWDWEAREKHYASILPRSTFILTGTQVGRGEISQLYNIPENRIRVLPQPTPEFALQNKTFGEPPEAPLPERFIFYPAQYWSHKNHVGLLKALKIANDDFDLDLDLVLAGSDKGNLKHVKETALRLGLAKRVHFLGFTTQEELIYLYQTAVALTFVTFFGPDNLPPLEAFALGCPVVASHVHGSGEQLGKAAVLVDPASERSIAEGIAEVAKNAVLRKTLIERGKKQAVAWTSRDYVNGILKIINEYEPYRRCWE